MKIAYLGDYFCPPGMPVPAISEAFRSLFAGCDDVFVNFEGPLVASPATSAAFKTGPSLSQSEDGLIALRRVGVTCISLANNHANDYGEEGLRNTLTTATKLGIKTVGVRWGGANKPVLSAAGIKVATLAFAEEEWCGSAANGISISIFDVIEAARAVKHAQSVSDVVVVILHGNNEYNSLPSPRLRESARFLIESGAGAVLVHHSHVKSGMEYHLGCPIVYGLGNFQFAKRSPNPGWYEGICALLDFTRDNANAVSVSAELIPTQMDSGFGVDLASANEKEQIQNEIISHSETLRSDKALESSYQDFVVRQHPMYEDMLNPLIDSNRLLRSLGRAYVRWLLSDKRRFAVLLNSYRCESHRNVMIRLLERKLESR